ncbi:hypothetical protein [Vreelandella arcis]|uniref:Uncharacterized protein n=1 Tax=Vreelandella arcis TaxID=416873 RepID=A0A1H0IZS4_9GAMM|nr:hypothetical protein [Halomonas arcis]SDO36813.1 hypothetical protein SAMN04487951_1233 [Halomonas arcis]
MKNNPYITVNDIPAHIFKNRILTDPVGEEFSAYLRYMLDNHPDDLYYIFKHGQKYTGYGGAFTMVFERWLVKIENNLKKKVK